MLDQQMSLSFADSVTVTLELLEAIEDRTSRNRWRTQT
jgi:hypothetical protein